MIPEQLKNGLFVTHKTPIEAVKFGYGLISNMSDDNSDKISAMTAFQGLINTIIAHQPKEDDDV